MVRIGNLIILLPEDINSWYQEMYKVEQWKHFCLVYFCEGKMLYPSEVPAVRIIFIDAARKFAYLFNANHGLCGEQINVSHWKSFDPIQGRSA